MLNISLKIVLYIHSNSSNQLLGFPPFLLATDWYRNLIDFFHCLVIGVLWITMMNAGWDENIIVNWVSVEIYYRNIINNLEKFKFRHAVNSMIYLFHRDNLQNQLSVFMSSLSFECMWIFFCIHLLFRTKYLWLYNYCQFVFFF